MEFWQAGWRVLAMRLVAIFDLIVEQREQVRGRLLCKVIEQMGNQRARPVWSWRERDEHSTA